MSYQVIKQPDGQLAIFSTYTDTVIVWDATPEEIMEWFVDDAVRAAKRHIAPIVEAVLADNARSAYCQFAMSWDEALEMDREHGGEAHRA